MTRLLIISTSQLSEVVHALRLATSLKAQRPDLRISWIVRDIFAPLVRACEAVDHTYVFRRNEGLGGFMRLMKQVRQTEFDYVFDFQGLLRTGLMTWRAKAKLKVGRSDAREGAGIFYNRKVSLPPDGRRSHAMDILLQFCPVLDAKPELQGAALQFRPVGGLNLSFLDSRSGAMPVVMFPDSRRKEKKWHGFKQLTEAIARDGSGRKVVWAGNAYVDYKDAPPENIFLNLTGNTSLVSLPSLIKRACWVICNDSGPLHLAAALGVPTLGIFGPTDPRLFGPYPLTAPNNHIVQAPVGNLKLLTAKDVYARFQKLDSGRPRTATPFPQRGF
jgi:ADP-heptose:LPS heptosyltransferase